ncbi:hypothetical protein N8I77_011980 [Diaporthe amygdali]|uniref:Uncharacterized protein n=1 Tax=Phomopsis amygdali TaxID=1214568 RepID=A0AAD9S3T0_PHOAM|nr:hypothetical protein N8I77_011980 [Diaporthe amygdali]
MADFKMVENRKYNNEEINYVNARIHAGWNPETIAKAFKQDHGEYWANREFTKKQVAYIRSTYKTAPGLIQPYTGPIPEFPRSPTSEESPEPVSSTNRKRKRAVETAQARSSSVQASVHQGSNSPIAGSSHQCQQAQPPHDTATGHGVQSQALASGSPSAPPASTNDTPGNKFLKEPFGIDVDAGDPFAEINYGMDVFEAGTAAEDFSLDPDDPNLIGPASPGQGSSIPDVRTLLPDTPLQSIEGHQSATAGGSNNANSAYLATQQPGFPGPQLQFPPGCTHRGAVARADPFGVWYFDPHDSCQIRLGHRHEMDGGVYFTNDIGVVQSMLAMHQTEAAGFMLGVAMAAEHLLTNNDNNDAGGVQHQALMRRAAQIVYNNIPADMRDSLRLAVPEPDVVRRLSEMNRRLPPGHFHDPFQNRVVRYDMARDSEAQDGAQGRAGGSKRRRLGTDSSGPPV